MRLILGGILVLWLFAGCDDGDPADGDGDSDGDGDACVDDGDCDDGRFCNGEERCLPDDPAADGAGCVDGSPSNPCAEDEECNEAAESCEPRCAVLPDADGDGSEARACGGDDCDDEDATRFPGNTEVCDAAGHDEDCDPATLGDDADGDGYVDDACCNEQTDGTLLCGEDCDDELSGINPGAADGCNGRDDDCDGEIDDEPTLTFYRDLDGDGFGVEAESIMACAAPEGYAVSSGDCDDTMRNVNPSTPETCDGVVDNDCNGTVDEGCECTIDATRACGPSDGAGGILTEGECEAGLQQCVAGIWPDTCVGEIDARAELCNGLDDDCDGSLDEDFDCALGDSRPCDTACGEAGNQSCLGDCSGWSMCRAAVEVCNGCDDNGDGAIDEGFDCAASSIETCLSDCGTPGLLFCTATCRFARPECASTFETCNFCDDNLNGTFEDERFVAFETDRYRPCCETYLLNGGAACDTLTIPPVPAPVGVVELVDGTPGDAGSGWAPAPARLGYGMFQITAFVAYLPSGDDPTGGFAIVLATGGTGAIGSGGNQLGVPYTVEGVAVEVRYRSRASGTPSATPTLAVRILDGTGTSPLVDDMIGITYPAILSDELTVTPGDWTPVLVEIRFWPELTDTPETEGRVEIWLNGRLAYEMSGGMMGHGLYAPGTEFRIGVAAASGDTAPTSTQTVIGAGREEADGSCPLSLTGLHIVVEQTCP